MMNLSEKIELFRELSTDEIFSAEAFYEVLETCGDLKANYHDYMTSNPINCDTELLRLPIADYDLCCALLTMLLREDHFCNGSFGRRERSGQVKPIIAKIIKLLEDRYEAFM